MPKIHPITLSEVNVVFNKLRKDQSEVGDPFGSNYDNAKLDSSLKTPFQTGFGRTLYKGFAKKAAILFYLIIKNHPFNDGNKRMSVALLEFFCNKNNKILSIDNNNLFHLAIFTAISQDKDFALIVIELVINKFLKSKRP